MIPSERYHQKSEKKLAEGESTVITKLTTKHKVLVLNSNTVSFHFTLYKKL